MAPTCAEGGPPSAASIDGNKLEEASRQAAKLESRARHQVKLSAKEEPDNVGRTKVLHTGDVTNQADSRRGSKRAQNDKSASKKDSKPRKNPADELKLFQNSNLLNQQDPIEQLQRQLNELIQSDAPMLTNNLLQLSAAKQEARAGIAASGCLTSVNSYGNNIDNENGGIRNGHGGNLGLSSPQQQLQQQRETSQENAASLRTNQNEINLAICKMIHQPDNAELISTVKKGVLWQQQNYDKFHQRLFSRWKKRYFILTTDYLVCFKRSSSKVGRSEMGKFLYKTSLGDIVKSEWTKPKKSDKGAIILFIKGQFNLFLWCKDNLDEWMFLIEESVRRLKVRRNNNQLALSLGSAPNPSQNGFYESRCGNNNSNMTQHCESKTRRELPDPKADSSTEKTFGSSKNVDSNLTGKDNVRAAESSIMINDWPNGAEAMHNSDGQSIHKVATSERPVSSRANDHERYGPQTGLFSSQQNQSSNSTGLPRRKESSNNGSGGSRRSRSQSTARQTNSSAMEQNGDSSVVVSKTSLVNDATRCDASESASNHSKERPESNQQTLEVQNNLPNGLPKNRPNLIRRDDSWQSLVSLTRVGKSPMQVAQRSLYAQHIMPSEALGPDSSAKVCSTPLSSAGNRGSINIESTVTPIRSGPLWRQQSVQVPGSGRNFRPVLNHELRSPHNLRGLKPSNAPPVFEGINSPLHANHRSTSYQHKLLHLQMLHNNAQSDYTHRTKNDFNNNDYQIYAPESVTTNHYGYYSMRSNLKSAASEFSFIRPSSSNIQPLGALRNQPQVPPLSHQNSMDNQAKSVDGGAFQRPNHPQRASMILANEEAAMRSQQSQVKITPDDSNSSSIGQQGLVTSKTTDQLIVGHEHDQKITLAELMAPNRELPLKPNRRRDLASPSTTAKNSSSLSSSIVCFFRRAFSRRSKRRPKDKLAESCSSSLGAFDDGYPNVHAMPSAFSTGGKSIDDRHHQQQDKVQAKQGDQRMIDMIEAFNDTINNARLVPKPAGQQASSQHNVFATPKLIATPPGQAPQMKQLNQFGSPLHKSNSISTTLGWTGSSEAKYMDNHNFLPRHRMQQQQHTVLNMEQHSSMDSAAVMTPRMMKVMSVNLTPSFQLKEPLHKIDQLNSLTPHHQQQLLASPRQRPDQLPRPSSIYGQPSMISSPLASGAGGRSVEHQFGLHRSSLHGGQPFGAYRENRMSGQNFTHNEIRRHQMVKTSFLDTTNEVAEEVSSPAVESKTFEPDELGLAGPGVMSSPMIGPGCRMQRQAIVNPILQSPRVDSIYDNHPAMLNGSRNPEPVPAYSHYDNKHLMNNQLLQQEFRVCPSAGDSDGQSMNRLMSMEAMRNSPGLRHSQSSHLQQTRQPNLVQCVATPSRSSRSSSIGPNGERSTVADIMLANSKPSAVVAPTTPLNSSYSHHQQAVASERHHFNNAISSPRSSPQSSARHYQAASYQQSPLVSRNTRVVSRSDGVQATITSSLHPSSGLNAVSMEYRSFDNYQPVVNIAGAPGINLDPSLAASLLRGTNINAYESSTSSMLRSSGNQASANSKAFLVSTRLSKTMAQKIDDGAKSFPSSSSSSASTTSSHGNEQSAGSRAKNQPPSHPRESDNGSPSGSHSLNTNSSLASSPMSRSTRTTKTSSRTTTPGQAAKTSSQRQESTGETSSSDRSKSSKSSRKKGSQLRSNSSSQSSGSRKSSLIFEQRKQRESSSEDKSVEDNDGPVGNFEEPEERNWITSKLVQ